MVLWDRIIGGLLIVACIPLWLIAGTFPELGGAFPRTVVATIAGLALLMVVRSFLGTPAPASSGEGRRDGKSLLLPMLVAAATAAATVAMTVVGFFPAMAGLCAVLFFVLAGERRLLYVAGVASALAFIYGVFVLILGVPLEASRILGQ